MAASPAEARSRLEEMTTQAKLGEQRRAHQGHDKEESNGDDEHQGSVTWRGGEDQRLSRDDGTRLGEEGSSDNDSATKRWREMN